MIDLNTQIAKTDASSTSEASDARKNLCLTLSSEDLDLLNTCSKNFNHKASLINTAWLGFGYFLGRNGIFPNFITMHPIIYLGIITLSYTTQSYLCKDFNESCKEAFVNSDLKTSFAQHIRQHDWPNIFSETSVKLLSQETEKEKDTKNQSFFQSLFSKNEKTANQNKG